MLRSLPREAIDLRVAVIGAGPAGCAAARSSAQAGDDVVVLERGLPGKEKPCGDALLPTAVALLAEHGIGTPELRALGGRPFDAIDVAGDHGLLWTVRSGASGGWTVPRAALDQALRDALGDTAEIRYGYHVDGVSPHHDGWIVQVRGESPEMFDGVVLAAGGQALLPQRLQVNGKPLQTASVTAYVDDLARQNPSFDLVTACRPGYGWVFPLPNGRANVGVCTLSPSATGGLRGQASLYLRALGLQDDVPWRGGKGPLWSGQGDVWHDPRGLLSCGDAAGLVDPLTGEGMTAALLSGKAAGVAMSRFLRERKCPDALVAYSQWVQTTFGQKYAHDQARTMWGELCTL